MSKITIIIPISRDFLIDRLFSSLEFLICDRQKTNLLTIVDGGNTLLYQKARNLTEQSKFSQRLCVFRKTKNPQRYAIQSRRLRIAEIKNESKQYIEKCDYVFGVEDDTLFSPSTLKNLLADYSQKPFAGMIEGVELGRWGLPYVGAWRTDNIYQPTKLETILPSEESKELEEIDAGGFYCYLTKYDNYINHHYETFENNTLGADVNYGLWLRQQGLKNYIDWRIKCEHYTEKKEAISLDNTTPSVVRYNKESEGKWRQQKQ